MNAAGLVVKALAVAIAVAATKRNFMVTSCVGRESERRVRRFERRSGEQQHSTTDLVGGGFLQCGQATGALTYVIWAPLVVANTHAPPFVVESKRFRSRLFRHLSQISVTDALEKRFCFDFRLFCGDGRRFGT